MYQFSATDIKAIGEVLGTPLKNVEKSWYVHIQSNEIGKTLALTLQNDVALGAANDMVVGSIVTVQTQYGYFEIHNCTGFLIVEPDEVIFVSNQEETLTSLVIGKHGTCSLFANIRKSVLHADFSTLDPTVLMAAMQLLLTENIVTQA